MIQMKSGVYGSNPPKRAGDAPFSLPPAEEARLVNMGVAVYINEPAEPSDPDFNDMDSDMDSGNEDESDGAPIGFDEMPPEDFDEDDLPDGVIGIPEYSVDMKASELREIGKLCGLNFKVGMSKQEMVDALDAHIEANMVDDDEFIDDDPDDAPTFDASEAVE